MTKQKNKKKSEPVKMFLDYIDFSEEELINPLREMTEEEYKQAKIEMKEKVAEIFAKYLK